MAARDLSLPKHKGLSHVEKVLLSYWFKIRPFYSEENGVDMLHPYNIISMGRRAGVCGLGFRKGRLRVLIWGARCGIWFYGPVGAQLRLVQFLRFGLCGPG